MLAKTLKALFLTSCSAIYIEEFDQKVLAQTKQGEGCVDCQGNVECEYAQVIANGWGNINGRLAENLGDGWIRVENTHLRPCHVRMDRTTKNAEGLKVPVMVGYNEGDNRTKSDWDGFSMWRQHPKHDGKNGWAGYFNCEGEGSHKVLSLMQEWEGMDLYLYKKDCKTCHPDLGGVCQRRC